MRSKPMRRSLILPLAAGAALLAAGSQAEIAVDGTTIRPGYWEVTNKVSAIVSKTTVEHRCIKPSEVAKFMLGPSNRHYTCTYPTRIFKDGQIRLRGQCQSKKGQQVELAATGSYSPSTLQMTADLDTSWAGLPISGRFTTDAKRLGDVCPPPEPEPEAAQP